MQLENLPVGAIVASICILIALSIIVTTFVRSHRLQRNYEREINCDATKYSVGRATVGKHCWRAEDVNDEPVNPYNDSTYRGVHYTSGE